MTTPASFKRFAANKVKVEPKKETPAAGDNNNSGEKQRYYRPRPPRKATDFTADVGSGRQYTSFEQPPRVNNNKPFPRPVARPLPLPAVVDPPIDIDTMDFKIDAKSVVWFHGRNHFLSNLFAVKVEIDGHSYSSIEHYYQATKVYMLAGAESASRLKQVDDAGAVKAAARQVLRNKATTQQIDEWKHNQAPAILLHAITLKFQQHKKLKEQLLATGDAILAHTYDRDNYFATACDGQTVKKWAVEHANEILKVPLNCYHPSEFAYVPLVGKGKNLLGAICMIVRKQLRDADDFDPTTIKMEQLAIH